MIDKVKVFHEKFGFANGTEKGEGFFNDESVKNLRVNLMHEELAEFEDALASGDKVAMLDALIDLCWVAKGTALTMGIPVEEWANGVDAVFNANMSKLLVESEGDSKRGHKMDVKKPAGWFGPEHELEKIIARIYGEDNNI